MLLVPQLVQNMIDAVTNGYIAQTLAAIPASILPMALERMGWTAEQFAQYKQNSEQLLLSAGGLILIFAIVRGFFAYAQTYMSEKVSQSIAFDFRNDLFAKIQRLSFSYHDRNQTGQLMVRATDDVEKIRLFIGQGLLQATQAIVMLVGTMIILFATNTKLTLVILPNTSHRINYVCNIKPVYPPAVHRSANPPIQTEYHLAGKPGWNQSH